MTIVIICAQEFVFSESNKKGPSRVVKELEEKENKNMTFRPRTNRHHPQLPASPSSPASVSVSASRNIPRYVNNFM
jgi:hypothetical protein